ncbi:MAG: LamG-like jellyroll fold domain-containing protein, partial [Chloroflexia bacterium]
RYAIRRGEARGSAVLNPRADLALLAPLDGTALARIGGEHPVVSGPLRFVPASGQAPRLASFGVGAALVAQTAQAGSHPGQIRDGLGLFVEEATTNLVTNPSFERNTEGWTIRNLPGGALVATVVESGPFGSKSIRLDNRTGKADAAYVTIAGDGNMATWSVYARVVVEAGATPPTAPTFGLQMSGLGAQSFALTTDWQRFALSGQTGGTGNERLIVVPAGAMIEIDAAQLEQKPYATSYADGSLGAGYGWDRVEHNSFSGRMPTSMQVNLSGIVSAERGAIGFWATPLGASADGAQLLALGDKLNLSVANGLLTLHWGEQVVGSMPWVQGETHHYALTWEYGILSFLQDGQLVVQTFLPDFALPGEPVAFVGGDATGAKAANVAIQDLAVWSRLPSRATLAAVAGSGEFLHAGIPQARTLDVTIALASQRTGPGGAEDAVQLRWPDLDGT